MPSAPELIDPLLELSDPVGVLAELVDPAGEGRGRALFAPLSGGTPRIVRLQLPLPNLVALEEDAHVAPLVAALDEARPTGIVNVSRDGIRAIHWALGDAEEVAWLAAGGPGAGRLQPHAGADERDRYQHRLEEQMVRFVKHAAQDVLELAEAHGWERMVLVGDPRLTGPLRKALPGSPPFELIELQGTHEWQRPHELVEAVAPELERAHRTRELELVREALDRAAAGGAGAADLAAVLEALVEGRVDTLLIESGRRLAGVRAPDGRLAPEGTVPEGAREEELEPVPDLVERMTELALQTSGRVVVVEGEAAQVLAEAGGVAAILRW